ncbi:MAG: DNA-3-methyladenine glycosylase I [Clostridia bacterium]|jgi:DNA-3-methyladenine glycosylase I|nr:DNA-3-methyladenine glycosylase I [Clostridia bacterium]
MERCFWVGKDQIYIDYHDNEWGVPVHDDRKLFEMLTLEGAQAGLSWITVLKKRENYKKAFNNFDVSKISNYDQNKIDELLHNEGIIRNRLKINSTVTNAKAFINVQDEFGSFDKYIWSFVNNTPIINNFKTQDELPTKTELSDKISKDLKKRGFKFVGSTIIYAYMQAIGMVNDHMTNCYKHIKTDD